MEIDNMLVPGILLVLALHIFKTTWDLITKRNNNGGMSAGDRIILTQIHTMAMETNKLMMQHFNEMSEMVSSIKELAKSIQDKSDVDTDTQKRQTEILDRMAIIMTR